MKKIATTFLSATMLCALLAAPALAHEHDDYRTRQGRDGYHQYYNRGKHRGFDEGPPRWAWNHGAEWREHHDWDDYPHRGDWDDRWHDHDWWFHPGYDRH